MTFSCAHASLITTARATTDVPAASARWARTVPLAKTVAVRILDHLTGHALDAPQSPPRIAIDNDVPF